MSASSFHPGEKQALVMNWWRLEKTSRFDAIICDGSVRSGKTSAQTLGFLFWSLYEFRGASFAICGKTIGSVRRNIIMPLKSL